MTSSLTLKLLALVGIFLALPVILYGQFEKADRQMRELVTTSLQNRANVIAQGLTPLLDRDNPFASPPLNPVLQRFAENGTTLQLMFRPKNGSDFLFIASAPAIPAADTNAALDSLRQNGILDSLAKTCSWDSPVELRYGAPEAGQEVLTSVVPILARGGCWVLISSHNSESLLGTAIGRPYWQTEGVRMAAMIYLIFAGISALLIASVWRSLKHFREVAREIRRGGATNVAFSSRHIVPELKSVATDIDHLVQDLHRVASEIRQTAEDNAHSFKAPLAIIRSALEPLKRNISAQDHRAQRAAQLIESSLSRLSTLVTLAQRMGNDTADFIEAPKRRINLTRIITDELLQCRDLAAGRGLRFVRRIDDRVLVLSPEGILEVIVENILENAISFSPDNGTITVTLTKSRERVDLKIEDDGPGIDPSKIDRIFERYFSLRPAEAQEDSEDGDAPAHAGLGLWIVRRSAEALGGGVIAANRVGGGLCLHVTLPSAD